MKRKLLIPLVSLLTVGSMLMPSIGMAQSATSTTQITAISALLQQIRALQSQIEALRVSQNTLQIQAATEFRAFMVSLSLGSKGDAVKALQALLAANPNIYPEGLITGYFGKATERALKRLQKENGLEQVGSVGPRTRQLLNRLLGDNSIAFEHDDKGDNGNKGDGDRGENKRPCAIVSPGHLIAPGWLKKHEGERPIVPLCQTLPRGIEKKMDGDRDDENDDDDNDEHDRRSTTTPDVVDTIAPIIRNLSATSIASTTASITWSTNENATSTLWYSTTTPLTQSSAIRLNNSTRKTSHSYNLTGLTASTTYYYLVKVSDQTNNSTTGTESSFITLTN